MSASISISRLPQWFEDEAQPHSRIPASWSPPTALEIDLDDPAAIARAVAWLRDSAPDHGTYGVACRVKDFGISEPMCGELMLEHWRDARGLGKGDDHVLFRVANAYRYGTSPVGIASPEAEFEDVSASVRDRRTAPASPRSKLFFVNWENVQASEENPIQIDGWYDRGAMVVTYGESNVGKSHIVLSQSIAIASGQPWAGYETVQGLVTYVAAEGGRGILNRISAYKKKYGLERIPFALVPCSLDLLRPSGDTKALVDLIKRAEDCHGQECSMLVLDTLSRVLAGGDENAPTDMGALVSHCDYIRANSAASVHLIHHSGKNKAAGARGHSLLRAATDTEIEIKEGKITARKQRDLERNLEISFRLESVPLRVDQRGKTVSAAVAIVSKSVADFELKLTEGASALLTVLTDINADEQDLGREGPVPWTTWWKAAAAVQTGAGQKAEARTTFVKRREELARAGLVIATNDSRWMASEMAGSNGGIA